MNEKHANSTAKALITGLFIGGCAIASLASSGCERSLSEQVAALSPGSQASVADLLGTAEKSDGNSKLAANHNETFLVHDAA